MLSNYIYAMLQRCSLTYMNEPNLNSKARKGAIVYCVTNGERSLRTCLLFDIVVVGIFKQIYTIFKTFGISDREKAVCLGVFGRVFYIEWVRLTNLSHLHKKRSKKCFIFLFTFMLKRFPFHSSTRMHAKDANR